MKTDIAIEKICHMQYRTIEKSFHEVLVTGEYKIIAEGNVCGGILVRLMEQTKNDKGKIIRIKGKKTIIHTDLQAELQMLRLDNKKQHSKMMAMKKLINKK